MAKIAAELEEAVSNRQREGAPGSAHGRILAHGNGWSVSDVLCTSGPQDRAFEEQHSDFSIAMVVAGTFQYRSGSGRSLLTPGSLLLGNAGSCFECGHEHAFGDRCVSFKYQSDYFEQLGGDLGVGSRLRAASLPAMKEISGELATACAAVESGVAIPWEEIGIQLAVKVLRLAGAEAKKVRDYHAGAAARVTRIVRSIEREPDRRRTIGDMAVQAKLSPYHFLRVFQEQTGLTPHQYMVRTRLRNAATRIATEKKKMLDIALDSGFGDVSNFNRAFRGEFGASPRDFRKRVQALSSAT